MFDKKYAVLILILGVLFLFSLLLALSLGAVSIHPDEIFKAVKSVLQGKTGNTHSIILFKIRLPRVLLSAVVGASLAVSGAGFQGFFRNPLADPYVIGASSGAALGAAIALISAIPDFGPLSSASLCAFVGALAATFFVFFLSRFAGDPPPAAALLLAGTALSALLSALLSLLIVLRDKDLHKVYYWLLGSFNASSWPQFWTLFPVMLIACLLIYLSAKPMDILIQGEETAESLGLDVKKARFMIAAGASLAAAAAVAAAGIIGFVGLVAPHIVRLISGPGHKRLIPASALCGAILLILSDTFARTVASPMELPVGIVTSVIGAPFFLYILARRGMHLGKA